MGIKTSEELNKQILKNADSIYGFFLGDAEGEIIKERVFNSNLCPEKILKNLVKAICTFAEETSISNQGTIALSNTKISFIKIQDITYVLSHNIAEKEDTNILIDVLSAEFERKSRAKFFSDDPAQVFAGASAVFKQTVENIFQKVITKQRRKMEERQTVETKAENTVLRDIERIEGENKTLSREKQKGELEEKLSAITFNILNLLVGIEHLVFIEHGKKQTSIFFQNGAIDETIVEKTLKVCDKYLGEIIRLMEDEDSENAIKISKKYQIIFVPLDENNFMYAIATKQVDPVLMNPVFERISQSIRKAVLEYKKQKEIT